MMLSRLLQQSIDWLEQRRFINLVLVLAYFAFIYHMHNPMVNLSIWVMNGLTLPVYNKVVIVVSIVAMLLFLVFIAQQLRARPDKLGPKVFYLSVIIVLIALHFRFLFEMNIEVIHLFEFPILSLLLFPFTRRFGTTILLAVPFMLLDEWHQYIVLYPSYVDYFEFNDIVIDINGCALAMVALMISGVRGNASSLAIWRRWDVIAFAIFLLSVTLLIQTGIIVLYDANKISSTWLVLNRMKEVPTFWRQYPGRDVIYHVMQPLESMVVIPLLLVFYFGMDYIKADGQNG